MIGLPARRRDLVRRDADAELAALLEGRIELLIARGMSDEDARDEAIRRIGGSVPAAQERLRTSAERRERVMSMREWIDGWAADTRYALRGLRREPVFSGFTIVTLALGIGANAAMYGVVDKLLLRGPAEVRDADRVVRLFWTARGPGGDERTTAAFDQRAYANLVVDARAFSGLAMYTGATKSTLLGSGTSARLVSRSMATSNLMSVLGARLHLGRFFTLEEQDSQSPAQVTVLGYGVWQSEFGGDPNIVGRSIVISNRPYTVVGVARPGFTGAELQRVDVWLPLPTATGPGARHWGRGTSSGPAIVGRLVPGATLDQATADATNAHRRSYDGPSKDIANARISVGPLRFGRTGTESSEVEVARWLAGLSLIVLLVACANIVNLLLARAVRRRREMAVRVALGAGRARLLRLLLVSSLSLALIGAAAGLVVAAAAGSLVRRVLLPEVDWTSGPVDGRVLTFSLLVALITGVIIGLLPALRASKLDIVASLKAGAREGGGNRSVARALLMTAQVALAMLLLIGAGLFVRSLDRVRGLDLGLNPARVVWLDPRWPRIPETAPPAERSREETRRDAFAYEVLKRIQAAPGVAHAAATIGMPFGTTMSITLRIPGRDSLPHLPGGFSDPDVSVASPDFFATMGTRLLRGRAFSAADGAGTERVAIVSETMAKTLWPGRDALGECLLIGSDIPQPQCSRVVGIVQDVRRNRIHEDPLMHYYVPFGQVFKLSGSELVVRPMGDAAAAIPALRALIRQMDPSITYVDAGTLQDRIDPQTRSWRIGAMIFSLFAVLALIVAAVGTFSVVTYLVEQRRHEIGVRVALGARGVDVVTLMMRGALATSVAGVAVGTVIALATGRFMQSLLFDTNAQDPAVIGGVALALIAVSSVASAVPALRARRVDPVIALRDE